MIKKKILIVDSDLEVRTQISADLMGEGYLTFNSGTSKDALYLIRQHKFDLIIMDMDLEDRYGLIICDDPSVVNNVPYILISNNNDGHFKMFCLCLGAAFFMPKPLTESELISNMQFVFKRHQNQILLGPYCLTRDARSLSLNQELKQLSRREYDLIEHFMLNDNIVFKREELLDSVWGYYFSGDTRTVDTHIKCLRSKHDPSSDYIKTV
jgi:DNA-binding response OmpR family regulator